jgi:hypothetical protein
MSDSIQKTLDHERVFLPLASLQPDPSNPNEMDDKTFNLLCDNVERYGITDPILVYPLGEDQYRIVGGHHRAEVAKLFGYEEVPCTVYAEEMTEDEIAAQMTRMNVIHGRLSPAKFLKMYQELEGQYSADVAAEMFGFADEEEFKKLVKATGDSLPPEMKDSFKEGMKEVKTIDDLSKLLNRLFSEYGDTLPYGYMFLDFGGKDSVWLRMGTKDYKDFRGLAARCRESSKTVDGVFSALLAHLVTSEDGLLDSMVEKAPTVEIQEDVDIPTLDFLDAQL